MKNLSIVYWLALLLLINFTNTQAKAAVKTSQNISSKLPVASKEVKSEKPRIKPKATDPGTPADTKVDMQPEARPAAEVNPGPESDPTSHAKTDPWNENPPIVDPTKPKTETKIPKKPIGVVGGHNTDRVQILMYSVPWEVTGNLSLLISYSFFGLKVLGLLVSIPLVFVGFITINWTMAIVAFILGAGGIWIELLYFYSTKPASWQGDFDYNTIIAVGIVLGVFMGGMTAKFHSLACFVGGCSLGICFSNYFTEILSLLDEGNDSNPLPNEIKWPIRILIVFIAAIYSFKLPNKRYLMFATGWVGSFAMFLCVYAIWISGSEYEEWFKWMYFGGIPVMSTLSFWLQCSVVEKTCCVAKKISPVEIRDESMGIKEEYLSESIREKVGGLRKMSGSIGDTNL